MDEIWKPINDYEGIYEISNYGRVYSYYSNRILNGIKNSTGYIVNTLCKNKVKKIRTVHSLVAEHFVPNPENKPWVNHKDGNKSNPYYKNLEWSTPSENIQHAYDTGLNIISKGKEHHLYGKPPHNKGNDSSLTNTCVCGNEYKTYNIKSKYCSRECYYKYRYNQKN